MAKRPPHTRPSTVAEAVAILLNTLGPERLERIRRMRREDLVELRFSLGSYILTEFGLRENNQTLLTACQVSDPGEAQAVILEALWTDLHPAGPPPDPPPPARIISDGQPGAARGALDFAISRRIPHGGWCPRRRKAARGPIPTTYDLRETPTTNLSQSIAWNIRDSDATLIVTPERYLVGASRKAINFAREAGKQSSISIPAPARQHQKSSCWPLYRATMSSPLTSLVPPPLSGPASPAALASSWTTHGPATTLRSSRQTPTS